jgi:ribosomal protein L29
MGEVYLAQDTNLARKVALKLLRQRFTRDREQVKRFQQEARSASALNHPNIITIFEIGQEGDAHYIASELIEGQTLRELIISGTLGSRDAVEIGIQAAEAISAAHRAGILHRDLKPANIMLRTDGYVKVLDFGVAKLLRGGASTSWDQVQTHAGWVVGTPRYMSPEQVRAQELDERSDVFSLGVVLYELITGQTPFDGCTPAELIGSILTSTASPLRRFVPDVSPELERIVSKALARERADRYQTAKELSRDLTALRFRQETGGAEANREMDQSRRGPSIATAEHSPCSEESLHDQLEPVGGAVPLGSKFYIARPTDAEFHLAIARRDSIVLVKGARQVGKTSLLARGLQSAREAGARVVVTDFQNVAASDLESIDKLLLTLAGAFAVQLDLDDMPNAIWNAELSASINIERYLRRIVFAKVEQPVVWGLDEVDRLFTCPFGSEIFGLFRSWHNARALNPGAHWHRLTLAIAYATEAHLFITDLNQSPFNVGTRLALGDFTFDQVGELNARYGSPLRDRAEVARYFRLVGGHPYLVRRGLHEMAAHGLKLLDLESQGEDDEGPFGDHLRRTLVSLTQDPTLAGVMRGVLENRGCPDTESFYRLRSAGLISGDSPRSAKSRCQLYSNYLETRLL